MSIDTPVSSLGIETIVNELVANVSRIEGALAILEASKIKDNIAVHEELLGTLKKDVDRFEAETSRLNKKIFSVKESYDIVKRVAGEIVDEQLSTLAPLLGELYLRLKPHVDWLDLAYSIRGDIRKFLSLRVGDSLNPRYMFSSGQRRAAGLAFLMSVLLSRSWCKLKTVILDDPVQHIDDFRSLHLVELLSGVRQSGFQIICTVEDGQLADLLSRRLRVLDENDGSQITMEYQPGKGVSVTDVIRIQHFGSKILLAG